MNFETLKAFSLGVATCRDFVILIALGIWIGERVT